MEKYSTLFLKIAIFLIGVIALAICIFAIPVISNKMAEIYPELAYLKYPTLIGGYITAILFFGILYQGLKLLSYIDKNTAFSELSVVALKNIKNYAIIISGCYIVVLPLVYHIADKEDAPGLILMGICIVFAALSVAVFAAVLQRLLRSAIDMKLENDLTV